jgi:hypothetical protein
MDRGRDASRSERTKRDVRLVGADYYYAVFQVAGRSMMTQNDEAVQLAVGDVALLDAAQPAACFAGVAGYNVLGDPRPAVTGYVAQHQINEGTYPSLAVLVRDISDASEGWVEQASQPREELRRAAGTHHASGFA